MLGICVGVQCPFNTSDQGVPMPQRQPINDPESQNELGSCFLLGMLFLGQGPLLKALNLAPTPYLCIWTKIIPKSVSRFPDSGRRTVFTPARNAPRSWARSGAGTPSPSLPSE